jgi:hypothetical protein
MIQYPNGAIIAPYAFSFYNADRDWSWRIPDDIEIDGTFKCRGYMIEQPVTIEYTFPFTLQEMAGDLCAFRSDVSVLSNGGYDEFCYKNSQTFNNRSYHFIDVCRESKECISAYRINDGYPDCAYKEDEELSSQFPNTCSKYSAIVFDVRAKNQPVYSCTILVMNSLIAEMLATSGG